MNLQPTRFDPRSWSLILVLMAAVLAGGLIPGTAPGQSPAITIPEDIYARVRREERKSLAFQSGLDTSRRQITTLATRLAQAEHRITVLVGVVQRMETRLKTMESILLKLNDEVFPPDEDLDEVGTPSRQGDAPGPEDRSGSGPGDVPAPAGG